ncbi:MAG: Gfo/Idh/MocA family oxidoreductase [Pirellulales bacterium]|nr:Gfo/Idh/MocA family oxidoreductase [Pirellulales bacterium]
MNKANHTTRREFLRRAGAAIAAPYVITSNALGADGRPAASERIVMGGIGIGNMGSGDQNAFLNRPDVQYVAACDVRKSVREGAGNKINKHYGNSDCKIYGDFRDLLARNDIDAVHIATPDHWHAYILVYACRNGKDVYCQKPESLTLGEGPLMVEAARRYARVVSGGSQRVMHDYRSTVEPCWNGELGTIKSINVNVSPLPMECNLPGEPVPADIDWNMWLGPAPWQPYHPYRMSGSYNINGTCWRSWRDYSGGGMTDWGAHHFGGATFAVDVRELQPVEVVYNAEKDGTFLTYRYPNGMLIYHNHPGMGNMHVVGTPGEKRASKPIPIYKGYGGIYGDFLHCVKTRQRPFRDIELAINTVVVAHLGNIAYQLKRSLTWDPAKQQFPGDEEANRFIDRAKREPWQLG